MRTLKHARGIWGVIAAVMLAALVIGLGRSFHTDAAAGRIETLQTQVTIKRQAVLKQRALVARTRRDLADAHAQEHATLQDQLERRAQRLVRLDAQLLDAELEVAQAEYRAHSTRTNERHVVAARAALVQMRSRLHTRTQRVR
jgi:hypothetical protein